MKKVIFVLLMLFSLSCFAEPSKNDIMTAINAGNLPQAETMINEVVSNHPSSAKAHYFKAQILAKENKIPDARVEFESAMTLDPKGSFSDPAHLANFKTVLDSATKVKETKTVSNTAHIPKPQQAKPVYDDSRPLISGSLFMFILLIAIVAAVIAIIYNMTRKPASVIVNSGSGGPMMEDYWGNTSRLSGSTQPTGGAPSYPAPRPQPPQTYYSPAPSYPSAPQRSGSGMGGVVAGVAGGMLAGAALNSLLHNSGGHGSSGNYGGDDTQTTTTTTETERYTAPAFTMDEGKGSNWESSPSVSYSSSDLGSSVSSGSSSSSDWGSSDSGSSDSGGGSDW
jgi:hypothetical protein